MSLDNWRRKRYYKPRVLIPLSDLTDTEIPDGLYYLTGAQVGVLRTLLQYADRRATWVAQYDQEDYLAPDADQWNTVQEFTGELEGALMTNCCEDILTALAAIEAALAAQGTTLGDMLTEVTAQGTTLDGIETAVLSIAGDTPDIVAALECICAKEEQTLINVTVSPDWPDYPGAEDAFDWTNTNPVTTVNSQAEEDACALAQAWYQAGFEWMTELVLPAIRFGFDKLIPAAAAAIAVWTGGVGLPAAIGVYATAELIQELLELGYDAAETNLENWLYTHKDDIVCPIYTGLLAGGTSTALWDPVKTDLVDVAPDLSAGDKFLVNLVMQYWGLGAATVAKEQNSEWYQSVVTPGFCDTCPEEPTIGSDWWALPIGETEGTFTINHPAGGYWQEYCWNYDLPAGQVCVGTFYEVVSETGNCSLVRRSTAEVHCPYPQFWPNTSGDSTVGWWYAYAPFTHTQAEVVSTLHPGATLAGDHSTVGSGNHSGGWETGWNCEGSVTVRIHYLVFQGTTPP